MANKKYKGILKEDLINGYGQKLNKGQEVIVYKRSVYDEQNCRTGKWEYHYSDLDRKVLIRSPKFLI
jgi:hypothetical protein